MLGRLLTTILNWFKVEEPKPMPLKMNLQFFADDNDNGDGSDDNAGNKDGTDDGDGSNNDGSDNDNNDTFTQDQLEKILDKRLKRERKKWQDELESEKKKQQMNAEERAQAEKAEAEQRAKEAQERANSKIRDVEAKAMALEMGVDPKKIKYFLKMADIADIEVGDDGEINTKAMKGALQTVLDDMPEFKSNRQSRGGADFQSGTPTLTMEQIANMSESEINANWDQIQKVLAKN